MALASQHVRGRILPPSAIDPENEEYFLDKTLIGITQQIENNYTGDEVKLTIFRLNYTGTCGRLWV